MKINYNKDWSEINKGLYLVDDKEKLDWIRENYKGRRICISKTGRIFLPYLEDIEKYNYTLIENAPSKLIEVDETKMEGRENKEYTESMIRYFKSVNTALNKMERIK